MGELEGKVALVTGAGQNIGRAIALELARASASIVVNGRRNRDLVDRVVEEVAGAGGQAMGVMADVSDRRAVDDMIHRVAERFGGVDILVSNAGLRRQTPLLNMQFDEWREILAVALDGAFLLARAAVPRMIDRGGGAIIAISGISPHVGTPNRCHVSAAKAGLEGFVRALAVELAPRNITCNCIAPGAIDTVRGETAGGTPSNIRREQIPLGRKGRVEEIAAMVRFLAGPQATYVTGQTIHVNGGAYLA
ncbi:MAG: SDR family NAD(P)-dependent oxidoreductase [Gammaproteobacteria bacterium]|nr:SDR family NAD(P)-dependent oxidoreductase [Gammaproteobacteria bacterium]